MDPENGVIKENGVGKEENEVTKEELHDYLAGEEVLERELFKYFCQFWQSRSREEVFSGKNWAWKAKTGLYRPKSFEEDTVRVMLRTKGDFQGIEFVYKNEKNLEQYQKASKNESHYLQRIASHCFELAGSEKRECLSGAEYLIWVFAFHPNKADFIMWPHAPLTLEGYNHTLPPFCLKRWARQILSGLTYLHSLDLVHRDLHPGNILITQGSIAMICDFENATLFNEKKSTWAALNYGGRREYVAPEYGFRPHMTSFKTDVWGFCATLSFALTGKKRIKGVHHGDILKELSLCGLARVLLEVLDESELKRTEEALKKFHDHRLSLPQLRAKILDLDVNQFRKNP